MNDQKTDSNKMLLEKERSERAKKIAIAGGVEAAIATRTLPRQVDLSVSEALILGLLRQGVSKFVAVFGHGSTEIAEVLRIYQSSGLLKVFPVRSEIEASHAATALRWIKGEKAAVVASIGPGPLQALAASLVPAANGLGVWYIVGDETSEDEGPNFQQLPAHKQGQFLELFSRLGGAYSVHTPQAITSALRRGLNTVEHPHRGGPFFMLLPMNIQPVIIPAFNLDELPCGAPPGLGAAPQEDNYHAAVEAIRQAKKIAMRVGGGARGAGPEIETLLEAIDGVAITAPVASGVLPYQHPRNMTVAGSKGSICGNYAMENADLLIAIGTRFVCQSDCSRTGYLSAQHVININVDMEDAMHYNKTTALIGDTVLTIRILLKFIDAAKLLKPVEASPWLQACTQQKQAWQSYKQQRYDHPIFFDPAWGREILSQPAAIKAACDWGRANQAVTIFDAGDVQAHGFQIVEDERLGQSYTDGGASYMGFGASAVLASALAGDPFYALAISGDGSFMMNPQILIDGVEHKAKGCILLLDNRRMAAISALQINQYGVDFATNDSVAVDYVSLAGAVKGVQALHGGYSIQSLCQALDTARHYPGLSFVHLPVYFGPAELGGLGAFGRWNVGNWSADTQALRHRIGL